MNRYAALFTLYVLIQNGALITKTTYDGMDQSTVDKLLIERQATNLGMTYQFVTKKAFDAVPDPVFTTPVDPNREQAILDAKNISKTADQRIDAILKIIEVK